MATVQVECYKVGMFGAHLLVRPLMPFLKIPTNFSFGIFKSSVAALILTDKLCAARFLFIF